MTDIGKICTTDNMNIAIENILSQLNFTYSSLLYQLPPKQKSIEKTIYTYLMKLTYLLFKVEMRNMEIIPYFSFT